MTVLDEATAEGAIAVVAHKAGAGLGALEIGWKDGRHPSS